MHSVPGGFQAAVNVGEAFAEDVNVGEARREALVEAGELPMFFLTAVNVGGKMLLVEFCSGGKGDLEEMLIKGGLEESDVTEKKNTIYQNLTSISVINVILKKNSFLQKFKYIM